MKAKTIGAVILSIMFAGGIAGGFAYQKNLQDEKEQELQIQNSSKTEVKDKQTSDESSDKKQNATQSSFESKIQLYLAEFRGPKGGINDFIKNLNSIDSTQLSAEDKIKLDNLKLATQDYCRLIEYYNFVKNEGDTNIEKSMKYAKDALYTINVYNLETTGVMDQDTIDSYISVLQKYKEDKEKELKDQAASNEQVDDAKDIELKKQYAKLKTTQEKEEFYYNKINEAMQKQIAYINSIEDPQIKQSVQSSISAAVGESIFLEMKFPQDSEIIKESLEKVTKVD